MGFMQDYVDNIFNLDKKEKEQLQSELSGLKDLMTQVFAQEEEKPKPTINPFLNNKGELINPNLPYQKLLDNPNKTNTLKSFITQATGLTPAPKVATATTTQGYTQSNGTGGYDSSFSFNANADVSNLASLDVVTELPKLSTEQIAGIISEHFSNSSVIKPSDAQGIFEAQQKSGMSALAILGIGALESGWGTSKIAREKNNLWGWNATNVNPGGNATTFSPVSQGALEFANNYLKTYYNGYGAKSIYSAGTGNNPKGMGYAYFDNGSINPGWATSVGSIMGTLYNTAKSYAPTTTKNNNSGGSLNGAKVGSKIANTGSYNNDAAWGQCVWYVRGRQKEKFGKDWGAIGNANEVWYNAPERTRLSATADNIKPDTVASYKVGSSGSQYGHVIYIEAVDGDTVYFTEGGSGYHKNGTDGTLKKTTKQDILNGTGGFGSGLIGLIDITKL